MTSQMPTITPDYVLWTAPPTWRVPGTGGPQRYIGDGKYYRFPLPENPYFSWLTSGADGSDVWGISMGRLYRLAAKPVEDVPMEKISAASDGTVWGLRDQVPHRLTNGVWQAMPGRMSWIECGSALEVWALDASWDTGGRPFRWSGTEWVQRGDVRLLSISAARDPRIVVGTTSDGRVVRWTPGTTGTWTEVSSTPFLQVVSVNNTAMYASDLVNIYEWNGHSWAFMYGATKGGWVSLADDGTVVVTDVNRRVWRSSGMGGWQQLPIPPSLTACAVDANSVWSWNAQAVGGHYWPGESWARVTGPGSMRTISAGVDGTLWATVTGAGSSIDIYRYHSSDGTWEQMPGTLSGGYVSVGSAAHVLVLDWVAREVRRWNTTTNAWDTLPMVPLQPRAAAIGGDGTILATGSSRGIQWYVYQFEDATGWSVVPDLELYLIGKICSANLLVGEVDADDDGMLWIGKLPAAAGEEAAEERELAPAREPGPGAARAFFGDAIGAVA
jgi:hypothetical protein